MKYGLVIFRGWIFLGLSTVYTGTVVAEKLPKGALLPDIVEGVPSHLHIQNIQQREILRFTTEHINIGDGPLQVRSNHEVGPCTVDGVSYEQCTQATQEVVDAAGTIVYTQDSGFAVFHPEHNHWHQNTVADFILRKDTLVGPVVATSLKTTFCLIDYDKTDWVHANNTRVYFDCNGITQGISVGWSDEYHHSTHGQQLDITGAVEGVYYLIYVADPLNKWKELNELNNSSWTQFELSRKGANPEIKILGHSECIEGVTCGSSANK